MKRRLPIENRLGFGASYGAARMVMSFLNRLLKPYLSEKAHQRGLYSAIRLKAAFQQQIGIQ
jgi:hypothetical protein